MYMRVYIHMYNITVYIYIFTQIFRAHVSHVAISTTKIPCISLGHRPAEEQNWWSCGQLKELSAQSCFESDFWLRMNLSIRFKWCWPSKGFRNDPRSMSRKIVLFMFVPRISVCPTVRFFCCGGATRTADFTIHDNQSIISEGGHPHIRDAPIIVWSNFRFWARSIRRIFLPKKSKHDIKWLMWEERDWGFPSTFLGPKGFLRLLSRGVVALWRGVERKDVMTCDACIHINLCWRICANISIFACIGWRFMYIYTYI